MVLRSMKRGLSERQLWLYRSGKVPPLWESGNANTAPFTTMFVEFSTCRYLIEEETSGYIEIQKRKYKGFTAPALHVINATGTLKQLR
jgi:hypothetical protein